MFLRRLAIQAGMVCLCLIATPLMAQEPFTYPSRVPKSPIQPVSAAEPESIEDRIKRLESELQEMKAAAKKQKEAEEKKKKEDDKLKKLDEEWKKFKDSEKKKKDEASKKSVQNLKLQGRIHLDNVMHLNDTAGIGFFEHPDPTNANFGTDPENRLVFRRLRFTMRGDVLTNMFWKLDLEFANPNNTQMRDALFGWKDLPFFGTLIIGNQKRPINLDQLNSSNHNVFMGRATISDAFQEESRRVGIEMYNYNEDQTATWQAGFFNNKNIQNDGNYTSDPFQGLGAARFTCLPFYDEASKGRNYMHFGVAGTIANYNGNRDAADGEPNLARFRSRPEFRTVSRWVNTGRIAGADWGYQEAAEFILNLGPLAVVAEYEFDQISRTGMNQDVFFHGGYIYIAYFLTGEHQPYKRSLGKLDRPKPIENFFLVDRLCGGYGNGWGAWQVAARYSYIDLTDADITGGVQNNLTLALNWWWNDRSRLMLNYIWGRIEDRGPIGGFATGDFSALAMRFQLDW